MSILQMNLDYAKENNLPIAASYEKLLSIPGGATLFDTQYNLNNWEDLAEPLAQQLVTELESKGKKQFLIDNAKIISWGGASGPLQSDFNSFVQSLNTIGLNPTEAQQIYNNVQTGIAENINSQQSAAAFNANFNPGGGFGNMVRNVTSNPLFPVVSAIVLPAVGGEIASTLGTSAATGTALASAGVQAAQGRPLEDITKGAAIGATAGTVGSNVAQSTGSAAAGQIAGQATGGLLSGADAGKVASNIGTSLLSGGITGAVTEATGSPITGGLVGSTASGLLQGKDLESSLLSGAIKAGTTALTAPTSTTPNAPIPTKTSSDVAALYGDQGYTGTTLSGGLMTDEEYNKLLDEYSSYSPMVNNGQPSAFDVAAGNAADVARNYDFGSAFTADENQTAAEVARLLRQNSAAPMSNFGPEDTALQTSSLNTARILSTLGSAGKSILDFAKANPTIAGSLLGAITSAVGSKNAPTSTTTTTMMDPQLKAAYLQNLGTAKETAAGLQARQFAEPGAMYTGAEKQLYNLGMTPFGAADIAKFYNPYQEQVVQGALGDIERTRQMQEQANMAQATAAKAFGGSRQGVVSGMTNEAALRQAATTGGQLRQQGFTQAANLGLAARPLDIAGLQTSLGLGTARTALEQARLDALRNLGTERLQLTSGALGMNLPNLGQSSTSPLYSSTAGNLLSGGLTGAYIGSLLDPNRNKQTVTG